MKLHANAALSLNKRRLLCQRVVEQEWTLTKAAEAAEVSVRTARKWVRRHSAEGEPGLLDRSSRPHSSPGATPEERVQLIALLRRSTQMTGTEIAEVLAMPITTVQGILTRIGLGKRSRLDSEQVVRYERERPGELVHVDVKKLGRIERGAGKRVMGGHSHYTGQFTDAAGRVRRKAGWEFCHVAIDDFSRLAYVEVLDDERATTAVGFLRRALSFFAARGVRVERVMKRQRIRLRLDRSRCFMPCAWRQAPAHPPAPAADERQGRALHPDDARRLGLRAHLRLKPRAPRSVSGLA